MRIVFMGTPDFSVPTLDALVHSRHEVVGVYTQPDREQGRGKKIVFSPVKTYALSAGIPVFQPKNLRKQETVDALRALSPDVIVVVAYGVILRQNVLTLPVYGCINVHASLLPKYRGAAPIQWAILDGEKKTGVTIMQMDEGLDTGNIMKQVECPIDPKETGESLFEKLSQLGGPALLTVLDEVEDGTVVSVPQGDSPTAYAKMLEKSMGALDLSEDA
ncbi:MAG: methionyl-tRNA formyltransferase, partial [Lachnospiraceae bacterium]|nr:methionyl-tRNA formyltransferase [Lachnospiraceae bacterium]